MSSEAPPAPRGLLFVVSAPSGTGKTTVVERLVERMPGLELSRSYTSRVARHGERHGVDYNFISEKSFSSGPTSSGTSTVPAGAKPRPG
jgi:guanylate kinase